MGNDMPVTITSADSKGESHPTLIFRNSSEIARRGACSLCDTSLLMDYEWFEPNTLWLVNPVWHGLKVPELKCSLDASKVALLYFRTTL